VNVCVYEYVQLGLILQPSLLLISNKSECSPTSKCPQNKNAKWRVRFDEEKGERREIDSGLCNSGDERSKGITESVWVCE
jgi:hypothetical protein